MKAKVTGAARLPSTIPGASRVVGISAFVPFGVDDPATVSHIFVTGGAKIQPDRLRELFPGSIREERTRRLRDLLEQEVRERSAVDVARRYLGWNQLRADEEERRYLREVERLRPPPVDA